MAARRTIGGQDSSTDSAEHDLIVHSPVDHDYVGRRSVARSSVERGSLARGSVERGAAGRSARRDLDDRSEYDGAEYDSAAQRDPQHDDDQRDEPGRRRRFAPPSPVVRSRAVFAAVAIGAIAAATAGQSLLPRADHHGTTYLADPSGMSAVIGTDAADGQSLEVQPVARGMDASAEAQQIAASQRITGQQSVSDSLQQTGQTTGATFAAPAAGTVVSTFGGQYGSFHYGIEIKNVRDTPIVASADGVIISAGPTSGFGLWVKEQLSDGTTLVYARMDTFSVQVGQHVKSGEQIAKMGDRGFSTGYTLHFEVWDPTGKKIDPLEWLNQRGITL